ncbi:hypothetical protein ACTOB_003590 [Actinoplanes oblitus]|uniref:Uncharacterized protein n=1 Tax=Actinoplanes oblitus TaxID=3040509 RepID=A0ABY8WST3_9ACTN|nr:hypothetical protein [Actinoplanes oblitus]WIM99920.1 hypothetical protein ACTOB_003590 [Actinoplanes oblitus]
MSTDDEHAVTLRLTSDEALVQFEWLHRCEDRDRVVPPEHRGEEVALWNFSALLERELVEPFRPRYRELVEQARVRLAGEHAPL